MCKFNLDEMLEVVKVWVDGSEKQKNYANVVRIQAVNALHKAILNKEVSVAVANLFYKYLDAIDSSVLLLKNKDSLLFNVVDKDGYYIRKMKEEAIWTGEFESMLEGVLNAGTIKQQAYAKDILKSIVVDLELAKLECDGDEKLLSKYIKAIEFIKSKDCKYFIKLYEKDKNSLSWNFAKDAQCTRLLCKTEDWVLKELEKIK